MDDAMTAVPSELPLLRSLTGSSWLPPKELLSRLRVKEGGRPLVIETRRGHDHAR
jgi:hypothetical protein